MKAANPALIALLATGEYVKAELWTVTLNGGVVVRWTSAAEDIHNGGQVFAQGPIIRRGTITEKRGVEVAELEMEITATGERDNINGASIIPFISKHGLDGANVKLERAYAPDWRWFKTNDPVGTVIRFAGRITSIDEIKGATAVVTVSSWLILLNTQMPRNPYQAACLHTVYVAGCGLVESAFQVTGSIVGAGATLSFASSLSPVANDFALGRVVFTSGVNNGESRTIRSNDGAGNFVLMSPLPNPLANGDTFKVSPGCDLTQSRCDVRFNNKVNYKGTDYVPLPQTPLGSQSTTTTTKSGK